MMTMAMWLLKVTLFLGVVAVAAPALRRHSAATRHWMWTLALAGSLALPALGLMVPSWSVVPVRHGSVSTSGEATPTGSIVEPPPVVVWSAADRSAQPVANAGAAISESTPASADLASHTPKRVRPSRSVGGGAGAGAGITEAGARRAGTHPAREVAAVPEAAAVRLPSFTTLAWAVWGAGFLIGLAGIAGGWLGIARLRKSSATVRDRGALRHLAKAMDTLGVDAPVRLLATERVSVPVTWGLTRPTILLPGSWKTWPRARLERVLLHELAHISRRDWATQTIGNVARACYWFHPLVWWANRAQRAEAEGACDDLVLAAGCRASEYATDLLVVAKAALRRGASPLSAVAMARGTSIADRVRAVLDPSRRRGRQTLRGALGAVVLMIAASVPLAALSPVGEPPAVASGSERSERITPEPFEAELAEREAEAEAAPEAPAPALATTDWLAADGLEPAFIEPVATALDVVTPAVGLAPSVPPAPSVQEARCEYHGSDSHSSSMHVDDDRYRIRWSTNDCSVEVHMEGKIEFREDDTGIERLSSDARFEIEERIGRSSRRLLAERSGARIEYRYWVDRDERTYDAEAQVWFAGALQELFRHTTLNADNRIERLLAAGGPDRVLAEVEEIHSSHVARVYLTRMMARADLDAGQVTQVIEVARRRLTSDHQLAELLIGITRDEGLEPELHRPYLAAASTLESDHQHARVLNELLTRRDLDPELLGEVIAQIDEIESDHQASELLVTVAARHGLTGHREEFVRTLEGIESDHQQARVIDALLAEGSLSEGEITQVLDLSSTIDSDHYRAQLLRRIAEEEELTGAAIDAFLRSAGQIDSDHNLQTTTMAVLDSELVGPEHASLVMGLVESIDSDHNRTRVLIAAIEADLRVVDDHWDQLVRAIGGIDSDHNQGEVITMIVESQRLDTARLVDVIELARGLDSDHQSSLVLLAIAGGQELDARARDAYVEAAESLDSEHQRDRALAALVRGRS